MLRKDLLNEQVYDRERADEFTWTRAKVLGLSRRQFIQLVAAGTGAAAPVRLVPVHYKVAATEADQAIVKPAPPELFVQSGAT